MPFPSGWSSDSEDGSDRDEGLAEDLDALRRALSLYDGAGGDVPDSHDSDAGYCSDEDGDDREDNDLELLQRLEKQYPSHSATIPAPGTSTSFDVVAGFSRVDNEYDEEDDFEVLRAVMRRFSHYEEGDQAEASATVNTDRKSDNIIAGITNESRFPKSAQMLVEALKKNRLCQKFIRRKLIEIEAKIEENKELKARVKCLMDFQVACKRTVGKMLCQKKDPRVKLISVRKSPENQNEKTKRRKLSVLLSGPCENPHVSKFYMVLKHYPIFLKRKSWTDMEKEQLAKGIKQQYQEMLIVSSMNIDGNVEGLDPMDVTSALVRGDLEITPENMRCFLPFVDWRRLAALYLPTHSGAECESRWLNFEDPLINHGPWTVEEEKKLLVTVQESGLYNWINISIALGTHRTPFQCLAHYQRSLNPHILNREWTKDEDARLWTAVEAFGDSNWQLVAGAVEGRTGNQCSIRWRNTGPSRKKVGRWSIDEDKRLKVAVMLFGAKNWNKIARFAPGRTQSQCRERWLNCLDPSLNLQPWTAEEDSKLVEAIGIHGHCWSKVATHIPPRTDNQCRRRWKILLPHEVPLLRAAKRVKRTVLVSNFVDREIERPRIGADDVLPLIVCHNDETITSKQRNTSKNAKAKPRKSRKKSTPEDNAAGPSAAVNQDEQGPGDTNKNTAQTERPRRCQRRKSAVTDDASAPHPSVVNCDASNHAIIAKKQNGTTRGKRQKVSQQHVSPMAPQSTNDPSSSSLVPESTCP